MAKKLSKKKLALRKEFRKTVKRITEILTLFTKNPYNKAKQEHRTLQGELVSLLVTLRSVIVYKVGRGDLVSGLWDFNADPAQVIKIHNIKFYFKISKRGIMEVAIREYCFIFRTMGKGKNEFNNSGKWQGSAPDIFLRLIGLMKILVYDDIYLSKDDDIPKEKIFS